tara:strand:+ start:113 stop:715 length:603 start_codon:yes stop_codon:yes gene_type:complete
MDEDIENRKWIKVFLGVATSSIGLIKHKKWMKEYADELGWIVTTDKEGVVDEQGVRLYTVSVIPNKDGLISPEELRIVQDKLRGFAEEIYITIYPDREKFFMVDTPIVFMTAKKKEEVTMSFEYAGFLILEYKLIDRQELESKSYNLEKFIFNNSLAELFNKTFNLRTSFYHRIMEGKEVIRNKEAYKERLKEWFKIKIG